MLSLMRSYHHEPSTSFLSNNSLEFYSFSLILIFHPPSSPPCSSPRIFDKGLTLLFGRSSRFYPAQPISAQFKLTVGLSLCSFSSYGSTPSSVQLSSSPLSHFFSTQPRLHLYASSGNVLTKCLWPTSPISTVRRLQAPSQSTKSPGAGQMNSWVVLLSLPGPKTSWNNCPRLSPSLLRATMPLLMTLLLG